MSDFDWDRKGPPRPGSSSMDHPRPAAKPYKHVTEAEKKQKAAQYRADAKARGAAIRAAERRQFWIDHGVDPDAPGPVFGTLK